MGSGFGGKRAALAVAVVAGVVAVVISVDVDFVAVVASSPQIQSIICCATQRQ